MATYPGGIFDPRIVENLPTIVFDAGETTTLFAEDTNDTNAEIVAIEETLGINPQGAYDSVAERLDNLPSGGGTWVKVAPTGAINGSNTVFTLPDTPSADSLLLFLARQPQIEGVDYTLVADTITYAVAPDASLSTEPHLAQYMVP